MTIRRTSIKIVDAPEDEVFAMNVAAGLFENHSYEATYECSRLTTLLRVLIDRIETLGEGEHLQVTFKRSKL